MAAASLLVGAILAAQNASSPAALANVEEPRAPVKELQAARRPPVETLNVASRNFVNGRFVLLNMHGLLFHDDLADVVENIEYASWLNAGVIRVFATDKIHFVNWSGGGVADRIVEIAPLLREANLRLIVTLMDQYREVPGDDTAPLGLLHGYRQLLLPFYTTSWRGGYREFINDLIWLVKERGASDVIWAWEIGNEIHTQEEPARILSFVNDVTREIRRIDDHTPILPGTMGGGILDPGEESSAIARELFCEAPITAYTLHTFDWWDEAKGGDVPIHWDLENVARTACDNGRALPVIVEELGTSVEVPGVYRADQSWRRLEVELRQLHYVLAHPSVTAVGVWSAESPRAHSLRHDPRRGLTSYRNPEGGSGSCYRPDPEATAGPRCDLEMAIRALPRLPDVSVATRRIEAAADDPQDASTRPAAASQ